MADRADLGKGIGQAGPAAYGGVDFGRHDTDSAIMNASLFKRIRRKARGMSLALVLAFLLPMVLALVPPAALSAETRLAQALAANVCTPGPEGPQPAAQHGQDGCCILCATGLPPVGEGKLMGGLSVAPPDVPADRMVRVAEAAPPAPRILASVITSRGPPRAV
jgi:hypothetical protein